MALSTLLLSERLVSQDISVAGKRAGIKHSDLNDDDTTTRSGLFFDAIRIIKEMRETNPGKPRYSIYENVGGLTSSNNGQDFRMVLEEFCHIVDPDFVVPMPFDGWENAGVINGDAFQIAWRLVDAQYWNVPQRRRRYYVLFDADGHTAKDIMFSRDDNFLIDWGGNRNGCSHSYGLTSKGSGDTFISEERHCALSGGGGEPGQGYPACLAMDGYNGDVGDVQPTLGENCGMSTGRNGVISVDMGGSKSQVGVSEELSPTLATTYGGAPAVCEKAEKICLNDQGGQVMNVTEDKTATLRAQANHPPIIMEKESAGFLPGQGSKAQGVGYEEETAPTLRAGAQAGVVEKSCIGFCPQAAGVAADTLAAEEEMSPSLVASQKIGVIEKTYDVRFTSEGTKNARGHCYEADKSRALDTGGENPDSNHGGICVVSQKVAEPIPIESHPADSRLTIKEEGDAVQTLTSRMGTGGGNVPYIMMPIDTDRVVGSLEAIDGPGGFHSQSVGEGKYVVEVPVKPNVIACLEGNGQRPSHKGDGFNDGETSYTLNTIEKPIVVYGIGSYASNAMLSDNPESGIYEAETAKTLDMNGGNPACNQGGMAVCEPVYSLSKNSHMTNVAEDEADTMCASQYKDPPIIVKPTDEKVLAMATQQGGAEIMEDKCPTVTAAAGMSGNNQPVIAFSQNQREEVRNLDDTAGALAAEPGSHQQTYVAEAHEKKDPCYGIDQQGGKGHANYTEDVAPTMLHDSHRTPHAACYSKDDEVREFIDDNNKAIEHQQDVLRGEEDVCGALAAGTHGAGGHLHKMVQKEPNGYIVRRLTPTECAKLQGFPTWWCKGLGTENPTDEEIEFWREVWITWGKISGGTTKPKTDNQLRKWLKDPYSDANEYQLWGNGICLQNALFIMRGIVEEMANG